MKILIATGVYPPESGGPATYSKLLEERLPALGFEVSVLPFRTVRHLPKLIRHVAYFFKCYSLVRRADIVLALDTVSVGLPAALAAKLAGKKFMVRVPGDYAWEQARQRFGVEDELDEFQTKKYGLRTETLRRIQWFVVRQARAVITPSEYMKRLVGGWTDSAKVRRIYSSIVLPPPFELPKNRPEGFLVVSAGRRVPWKNFEGIERAVLREKNWRLYIAKDLPREQALGWIKTADVFVLNSTYEGLSHLLVEALSLGTPVVATNVGGNPEVIGDAGLLIPPKDDDELYRVIKNVSEDRVAADERVARGLVRVKAFNIDTSLGQLVSLFNSI